MPGGLLLVGLLIVLLAGLALTGGSEMRPSAMVKLVYILALAAFIPMAVGFGIAAFYKGPEYPTFDGPRAPVKALPPGESQPQLTEEEQRQRQAEFEKAQKAYELVRDHHSRNVFIIAGLVGVGVIAAGLILAAVLDAIRSGLVLGGTITVVYGAGQYFGNASDATRFIIVTAGLALLLALGYWRLRDWAKQSPA
ncbi:MAG: hypothetical protein EXR60_07185 [Dehalococcoidia bacterium]|nr:hypothetical protein [Dehalococcoidia bacterium]